jgi:hypothetical protein
MKCCQYERDSDEIISLLELSNQFSARWIMKHHRRDFQIIRYIIERVMNVCGSRAEDPLGPGDLSVKEFIAYAFPIAVFRPEGSAYTSQKQSPVVLFLFIKMYHIISLSAFP